MDNANTNNAAEQHYDYGQLAENPDLFGFLVGWVAEMALVYSHMARMNGPTGGDGEYWDKAAAEIRRLAAMLFGYCVHCRVMAPPPLVEDMKELLKQYGPQGYRTSRQAQHERESLHDDRYKRPPDPDYSWEFPTLLTSALEKEDTGQFGQLCETLKGCLNAFTDLIEGAVATAPEYRKWISEEEYEDIEPSTAAWLGVDLANFAWSITGGQTPGYLVRLIRAFDNERIPYGDWWLFQHMRDVVESGVDTDEGDSVLDDRKYEADSAEWDQIRSKLLNVPAEVAATADMTDPLAPDHRIGRLHEALDRICAPDSSCIVSYLDCCPNQVPWDPSNADYIPASGAEVISQNKITMQALSNETTRNTRIRFMKTGRQRRVHKGDFLSFLFDRGIQSVPASDEPHEGLSQTEQSRKDKLDRKKGRIK